MDSQKIKVYSTPTCAYCFALKNFLEENNISFEEIDIAADNERREEMIKKSGQMQVPMVEINGKVVIGFDKEKIKNLLNLN